MAKRAPARRRPRKAKPGTKGLDPAQCRLEQSEGSAAEAAEAVEKAGGCVVGQYKEPLGGHPTLVSILPIDKIDPTPFQRDLSDSHHKRLGGDFIPAIDFSSFGNVEDPGVWSQVHDEGVQILENIANIRVPVIAAIEGRAYVHSEYSLLANVIVAAEDATFHDIPHFAGGIVPGDGIFTMWSYRTQRHRDGKTK